jgi:hypothetical protein
MSARGLLLACDAVGCDVTALVDLDGDVDWRRVDSEYELPESWTQPEQTVAAVCFCPAHADESDKFDQEFFAARRHRP